MVRHVFCLIVLISLVAASCGTSSDSADTATAKRPNLVLLMADDMGYETISANGGQSYQTPEFEQLAREGVRFTNCYSQPVCTPSRVKIMTGRSNWRNYRAFGVLIPEEVTFAQILREAGYKTGVAGKWQLSGGGPGTDTDGWGTTPEAAGFEETCLWAYPHYLSEKDRKHCAETSGIAGKTSRYWNPAILKNGQYVPTTGEDFGPDIYSDFALDFIERHKSEPFFLYYPMTLTHAPFVPTPHSAEIPEGAKQKSDTKYFGDMVAYTDYLVGKIRDRLEELGLAENTLVLFTGDNGTGRNIVSRFEDRDWKGGKATPLDSGTHVPFFAWWKGVTKPGAVQTELVEFSDFLPTLAEAGGAALPEGVEIDGRSFLPLLKGEAYTAREWVFEHYDKDPYADQPQWPRVRFARTDRYKLYHDGQFYDVPADWGENTPIATGDASQEASAARQKLQTVLDAIPPPRFGKWKIDGTAATK